MPGPHRTQIAESIPLHRHVPITPGRYIRLLSLQPSPRSSDLVVCNLREICLDDHLNKSIVYEALSYVWGSSTGSQEIVCDGARMFVTPNCLAALKNLRWRWCIRTLWVDAICINQESILEKSHQVNLMGEIYKQASRVIIWLGCDNILIEAEIRRFRSLAMYLTVMTAAGKAFKCLANASHSPQSDKIPQSRTLALVEIAKSEWFNRVWTFQELCLSRHPVVVYGHVAVSWVSFIECLQFYQHSGNFLWPSWYRSNWMREAFDRACVNKSSEEPDRVEISRLATSILHLSRQRECQNPLDKIYGFGQVFRDLGIRMPEPAYSASIQHLYSEVTARFIQNTMSLRLLEWVISEERLEGLPSWVPDYNSRPWPVTNDIYSIGLKQYTTDLSPQFQGGKLKLSGIVLGQVESLATRMPAKHSGRLEEDMAATLLNLHRWRTHVTDPKCAYAQNFGTLLEYHITLLRYDSQKNSSAELQPHLKSLFDLDRGLVNGFSSSAFIEEIETMEPGDARSLKALTRVLDAAGEEAQESDLTATYFKIKSLLEGMILFIAENGYCGVTTAQVAISDIIVLFAGATVPMLVRNSSNSNKEFHLVGPASMSMVPSVQFDEITASELQHFVLI